MNTKTLNQTKKHPMISNKFALPFLIILMILGRHTTLNAVNSIPMIRIQMATAPNYVDESVIYYQAGATDGFDSDFDAYKFFGPNPAPHISLDYNSLLLCINGISPVNPTFTTNIRATTNVTKNFTISASDFEALPKGTCVFLQDIFTDTTINLLTNSYSFNLSDTTTTSRFTLTITYNTLPVTTSLFQPSCETADGGKFKIKGNIAGPWNYIWRDSLDTIIQTSQSTFDGDSLSGLSSGTYNVLISSAADGCYSFDTNFVINKKIIPFVSFSSPDTIIADASTYFTPINQSSSCLNFYWDFGDGQTINGFEPNYFYTNPGLQEIKLIGVSDSECKDSVTKTIYVVDFATHISKSQTKEIKLLNTGNNIYMIQLNSNLLNELHIELMDLTGRSALTETKENLGKEENILIDLSSLMNGIYLLNLRNNDEIFYSTKIIIN